MQKDGRCPRHSLTSVVEERAVSRFLDALSMLPSEAWLQAAAKARENALARNMAVANIDTLANRSDCCLPMWRLNDNLETILSYRFRPHWRISPRHLGAMLEAADVARRAACAVLLRRHLRSQEFRALYGPFDDIMPLP